MHATVQPGGRSPKPTNGPTSTSQLKPGSDSVQNIASSFPSQNKAKKRERGDQGYEPIKRERYSKVDDGDSGHCRSESILKSEIPKITEKGGLVDSEGVEKLVQLMLPERNDKKIDLVSRLILAGVIAATEKFDCLSRFVQLKGLPVLDEWLQEVHKGKIGDGSIPKDSDKSVEEFLLVLLRALDKLPVNLHALQMCNIGKSVNHLRTHKNLEIQKKARSLVDTWKKRVEAEMNINDTKSGSNQAVVWSPRSCPPEVSHCGNIHSGGSSDVAVKSLVTQLSASKTASVKLGPGESTTKSTSASPGLTKSVPSPVSMSPNLKDGHPRNATVSGASDLPLTTARDEKSSNSSQSHNNGQSCSSDHAKTGGFSGKENARSSTAGSLSVNKTSCGSSRHRKSNNGSQGQAVSLNRNSASEKLSHSGLTCEKAVNVHVGEGNSHKLIVKIPNRGRSPSQSASGGSFEGPSIMNSRASSPVLSEKHDQFDRSLKEKCDAYQVDISSDVNTESLQSNDFKYVLTASDEADRSPAAVPDEDWCTTGDEARKLTGLSKAASLTGNELKAGKLQEASFNSINALIESCIKYSQANASLSVGDDVGMNLLASVAAGEMSKFDLVPPTDSPQRNTPVIEHSSTGNDSKMRSSPGNDIVQDNSQSNDAADENIEKHGAIAGTLLAKNGDSKTASVLAEEKPADEQNSYVNSFGTEFQKTSDPCLESNRKSDEIEVATSVAVSPEKSIEVTESICKQLQEKKEVGGVDVDGIPDAKPKVSSSLSTEDMATDPFSRLGVETVAFEGSLSFQALEIHGQNMENMKEELNSSVKTEQKPPAMMHSGILEGTNEEVFLSGSGKDLVSENVDELKADEIHQTEKQSGQESNAPLILGNQVVAGLASSVADNRGEYVEENLESKEFSEQRCSGPIPHKVLPSFPVQETEQRMRYEGSKLTGNGEETEECTSSSADASSFSAAGWSDMDAKVEFDLNEGLNADDGKYGEPNNLSASGCSASVQFVSPLPFPSSGFPTSITVAAAAKGPFVPPDDLLRTKGELGWKGSAATSAFRPAEPRKVLEMPLGVTNISLTDATTGKHSCPLLDIDLNVPDERILEDMASRNSVQGMGSVAEPTINRDVACDELMVSAPGCFPGGLDLDLNQVDEATDLGNYSTSSGCRLDIPVLPIKSSSFSLPNGEVSVLRDFDLNNGPVVDEVSAEPSSFRQHASSSVPSQPPVSRLRMNNPEMGNFSSWFPPAITFSAIPFPSILPDRGEQPFPIVATGGPQRMLVPPTGATPFSTDVYRGALLSASHAVPFPSTPFQFPVFPAVHSQLLGPAGAASSSYPRPYAFSLSDASSNGAVESNRKWERQSLDLNAGPGGPDVERRDETLSLASRQFSVDNSQALAEEQARMYQVGDGVLKRKEPEGGWDSYKQSCGSRNV